MKEYETKATQWKVSATQNWRMWCRNRRPWFESVWDTKPQRLEGRGFRCKDPKIRGYKDSTVRPNGSQIGSCKWHLLVPTLLSERSWNHGIPEVSRESQPNWIKIFKTRVDPTQGSEMNCWIMREKGNPIESRYSRLGWTHPIEETEMNCWITLGCREVCCVRQAASVHSILLKIPGCQTCVPPSRCTWILRSFLREGRKSLWRNARIAPFSKSSHCGQGREAFA